MSDRTILEKTLLYGYQNAVLQDVDFIVSRIRALREHTERTGSRTTRSQNQILEALPGVVLAEVLVRLETQSEVK